MRTGGVGYKLWLIDSHEQKRRCSHGYIQNVRWQMRNRLDAFCMCIQYEITYDSRTALATTADTTKTISHLDGESLSSKSQVLGCCYRALECTTAFRSSQDFNGAIQIQGVESGEDGHKHLDGCGSCHVGSVVRNADALMMTV